MHNLSRDQHVIIDSSSQTHLSEQATKHVSYHAIELEQTPFAAFYQQHHLLLLSYIRRYIFVVADAEDILVEVFLAALQNDTLLNWTEGQQFRWLQRVAHNKIVDHQRRLMRQHMISLDTVSELIYEKENLAPEHAILHNEEIEQLHMYIARLPQLQQEILHMRFAENLPSETIARRVRKSSGAVRKILARSLNFLRTIYARSGGEEA